MWWQHYGFESNPLDIRPNDNVLGLEDIERQVTNSIESGEIFLLYGPIGCGKTSLALKILKKLRNKYNFIYINAEEESSPNIRKLVENVMYKKYLFFKVRDQKPIVLIIDEFQNLNEAAIKCVKALYDARKVHSPFLIQVSENVNAPPSFTNRIYRKIYLEFPDEETIVEIVKTRLNEKIEVDEKFLRELIKKNDRCVRSVLIELNKILSELEHPLEGVLNKELLETKEDKVEALKISPQQEKILEKLISNKLTVKQLAELTSLPYNTVSKQVSRLVERGLLIRVEENKKVYYEINPTYLKDIMKRLGK